MWNIVQRYGLRSGVYYWTGSESEVCGLRSYIQRKYNESVLSEHELTLSLVG